MRLRLSLLVLVLVLLSATAASAPPVAAAQEFPACDDRLDNDGDGDIDWYEDATCADDPDGTSEGPPAVCGDGVDNDSDGRIDRNDPGCRGRATGSDETDPAPVPSRFRFDVVRPYGCGIETGIEVLPDLTPVRLFPFGDVTIRVRGVAGKAREIDRTRRLPVAADPGYAFERLRPGRFKVAGTYLGDPFRLPAPTVTRQFRLSPKRCLVYVSGSGDRRYKPRILYLGASQRIYDLSWTRWGRGAARGRGTFPANDCTPDCATGTITPYPIRVRLSRVRVCDGYLQYVRLRWTYATGRPPGSQRSDTVSFGYNC